MTAKGNALLDDDNKITGSYISRGALYISTPGATTITNAGTFYLLQGVSTAQLGLNGFTHSSPGRLTYTGTVTRGFTVHGDICITSSANNIVVKIRIAKNGITEAGSEKSMTKTTGTDTRAIPCNWEVSLATNDYIEFYVTCDNAGSIITATSGTLMAD